jgi:tetratricopeptide (TPR) repeat protein
MEVHRKLGKKERRLNAQKTYFLEITDFFYESVIFMTLFLQVSCDLVVREKNMKNRLIILSAFIVCLLFSNIFSQPTKDINEAKRELALAKEMLNKGEALQIMAEIQIRQAEYYLGKTPNLLTKITPIMSRINLRLRKEPKNAPFLLARSYANYAIADYLGNKTPFGTNKLNDAKIKNNLNLAGKDIEKAIGLDKSMGDYFSVRGKVRVAQCKAKVFQDDDNCYEKPLRDFTNALFSSPNEYTFYDDRIELYKAYNKTDLAQADEVFKHEFEDLYKEISLLQERLETKKTEESYYRLGQVSMMAFEKILEFANKNTTDDDFAIQNYHQNQFELVNQAKDSYDKAIELLPNQEYLFSARGWAYIYLGSVLVDSDNKPASIEQFNLSIKDFNEAIRLNPNNPQHYKSRAVVYDNLGKPDLKNADLEKAKTLEKP